MLLIPILCHKRILWRERWRERQRFLNREMWSSNAPLFSIDRRALYCLSLAVPSSFWVSAVSLLLDQMLNKLCLWNNKSRCAQQQQHHRGILERSLAVRKPLIRCAKERMLWYIRPSVDANYFAIEEMHMHNMHKSRSLFLYQQCDHDQLLLLLLNNVILLLQRASFLPPYASSHDRNKSKQPQSRAISVAFINLIKVVNHISIEWYNRC